MQHYRCKCGEQQCWASMPVAMCSVCEKCGTTLQMGPVGYLDPVPHRIQAHIRRDTIDARCIQCGKTGNLEDAENLAQLFNDYGPIYEKLVSTMEIAMLKKLEKE